MPRAFTLHEKAAIRVQLIEAAMALFGQYGLKKTSVDDIVRAAHVAKGTFYQFFDSKEALYFEVFSTLEDRVQKPMLDRLASVQPLTPQALADFLVEGVTLTRQEPLLRRLMSGEDFDLLWRRLSPEQIEALTRQDEAALGPLIEAWQERGEMVDIDPALVVQAVRGFYMLTLHEREIGTDRFEGTLRLMAEAIAQRLVRHD